MRGKLIVFILILCGQFSIGQVLTRKTLHGRVVNDSVAVENGLVFNVNAKTGTLIDQNGYFNVLAKVKDTLVFTSLGFKTQKVVLTDSDISSSFFRVKLFTIVNELMEVVVHSKIEDEPNLGDTQKIVDTQYYDDKTSSPVNNLMMPTGTGNPNAMDCIRMYKKIFKSLKKNNPDKTNFASEVSFTSLVMQSVNYSFFTQTLKLKDDEIGLFLLFCENDPKSKTFSNADEQFQMMDFLILKNIEFKKITASDTEK